MHESGNGTFRTCRAGPATSAFGGVTEVALQAVRSAFDPGCVKTCTSRECAELFSFFSSFDGDCQSGSFLIQCNHTARPLSGHRAVAQRPVPEAPLALTVC